MQTFLCTSGVAVAVVVSQIGGSVAAELMVEESMRTIPVVYDVDVVVVGGSTGAVTGAVAAARAGADVFLAAGRPYLGDDVCGTYRLWLEHGQTPSTPLARAMFAEPSPIVPVAESYPFTYETDAPSRDPHKDTSPPSMLADGKWASAYDQSVQFNSDVNITLDLGDVKDIGRVHLMVFQRSGDFETRRFTVQVSEDGETWHESVNVDNGYLRAGSFVDSALYLTADSLDCTGRYLKLRAEKTPGVERQLLAEVVVEPRGVAADRPGDRRIPPMPMQVKLELDQALIDAGVDFLYGCYATDVLRDSDGNLAGIVMANRAGRQAVRAKVIIDATPRAQVARLAGASFAPFPAGPHTFKRIVVGGEPEPDGPGVESVRKMPAPVQIQRGGHGDEAYHDAFEYTLRLDMPDCSFASYAEAEQKARDLTWHRDQVAASDMLFHIPPDPVEAEESVDGPWPGVDELPLSVLRPEGQPRLFVLSGCADITREAAARLLRPLNIMAVGTRVGRAAAQRADDLPVPGDKVAVACSRPSGTENAGEIREALQGLRRFPTDAPRINSATRGLPVLGTYDVVVVGGGTGGAPAGISAVRHGADTLVVEYLHGLGGVGTLGLIGKYYHGYREGFTAEIDKGVAKLGGRDEPASPAWNVEWKMEWYRRELRNAGADVWFGTIGCGAVVQGERCKGVVVATPLGRGVVLAGTVIDSTGNSDIAAAAGAECVFTDGSHVAVQGTGLPPRKPGANYTNTDYTITDDADMVDRWRTFVMARAKFSEAYDLAQIIDSRERRRIVGDFTISPLDIFNRRTYPDTVALSQSNFDTHGFTIHPLFYLKPPDKKDVTAYTPYRALMPRGLERILVTGLGISAHRDAMPILRMQPDIQNQGYAVGIIAARAAAAGKDLRQIELKPVQKHLVDIGNLPESVLTDEDLYPMPVERIAEAVQNVVNEYQDIAVLLAQPEDALPLLRHAYADAPAEDALVYAHIMAMMGDSTGAEALLGSVESAEWDTGWSYTGMGQFGNSLSPLDSRIIALGYTRDDRAVPVIIDKAVRLDQTQAFSHFRAVSVALETLRSPKACETLANLLEKPGISGHAWTNLDHAMEAASLANPNLTREQSLRELIIARALCRCGDYKGIGEKTLRQYAADVRGHLACHAEAVLEDEPQ